MLKLRWVSQEMDDRLCRYRQKSQWTGLGCTFVVMRQEFIFMWYHQPAFLLSTHFLSKQNQTHTQPSQTSLIPVLGFFYSFWLLSPIWLKIRLLLNTGPMSRDSFLILAHVPRKTLHNQRGSLVPPSSTSFGELAPLSTSTSSCSCSVFTATQTCFFFFK